MAKSEYERYIRTDELLALQKGPGELVNPDELLFQVTHQAAELWMKLVAHDVDRARLLLVDAGSASAPGSTAPAQAAHLLRRSAQVLHLLATQITILETMPQADYHVIRTALGRGSGQESPGFNWLLDHVAGPLWTAYETVLRAAGVSVLDVIRSPTARYDLWTLSHAFMEYDEGFQKWRYTHYALVRRIIGSEVMSLKGVPASQLIHGTHEQLFPELWKAVNALTRETRPEY
jgi:tryptophan 2,3-dioxygenase